MDYSKQRFERLFKDSYPHMYRIAHPANTVFTIRMRSAVKIRDVKALPPLSPITSIKVTITDGLSNMLALYFL